MKNRVKKAGGLSAGPSAKEVRPLKTKGWCHVNIGRHQVENLRAIAHCLGTTLRTFLELTIRCAAYEEAKALKIDLYEAAKIPMERRKAMARRRREIYRLVWRLDCHKN